MIREKLFARELPSLMKMNDGREPKTPDDWRTRRRELIDLLSREEYGFTPEAPEKVRGTVESGERAFAGKAVRHRIRIAFDTPGGEFSFPVDLLVPTAVKKAPVFLCIAFSPEIPNKYLPAEEIIDSGFAIANLYYQDVTSDSCEWDGLAKMYPRPDGTGWGKIGMWAFAASRVMDYLETREDIDPQRVCVSGHSRLGKTALWCAAQDERFSMAVSNDSGCSGAAITRGKAGEKVRDITNRFPFWFCENYQTWSGREEEMPFEQHMLLALIAPRKLYACSATDDEWADPESEFLCCAAADEAWRFLRVPGLVTPDAMPEPEKPLMDGGICYHLRTGEHFLSRTDWQYHMACRGKFCV